MKKISILSAIVIAFCLSSNYAQAQFFVKIRPTVVVKARPIAPSRAHIWIEPEYVWRGGNYVMVDGYWAAARPGFVYVPGHWRNVRRGYTWVPGHWRRI